MEVFVKDFTTYRTIKQVTLIHSALVIDSLDSETSSLTVRGLKIDQEDTGNWLIIDSVVYQIAAVAPVDDKTELTLRHPLDAFLRPIALQTQVSNQTIGGFVSDAMQKNWIEENDPMYAIPYLVVSNLDTTAYVAPEVDEGGYFILSDYCRLMRKSCRVSVTFSDTGNQLLCTIARVPVATRNVSFADGRSLLESVTYGTSGYTKLTVLHDIKTGEKNTDGSDIYAREVTTWYLSEDGEVSQLIPSRRSKGKWGILCLKDSPNVEEKVIEEFSKNRSGHKLTFWSALNIEVNTNCTFVVHGSVLRSYISYKRKDSTSKRFYYKAGELATTVTEKIKGVIR